MKTINFIGIIGANQSQCTDEMYQFAVKVGSLLSKLGLSIVCGGMGGVMEAVCKGAKESPETFKNQTIGIIPGSDAREANQYIDVVIPTGIGISRNSIIINSSDILIAFGGGAGTLSEIAFSWQKGKKVLCLTAFDGWAKKLAGTNIDDRNKDLLIPVKTLEEIESFLQIKR